jgi:microcystin-dependent protein
MTDPFIAEIRMFGGNFAPRGWATCDGQLVPINQNQALFSLLGTSYGGNGITNFALPDLRGRTPVNQGEGLGLSVRAIGEQGGTETVQLFEEHLPPHSHRPVATTSPGNSAAPAEAWARNGQALYAAEPDVAMRADAIAPAGLSHPHNNLAPYVTLTFIIALVGSFPTR